MLREDVHGEVIKDILEPRGFKIDHHHNGHAKMVVLARKEGLVLRHIVPSSPRVKEESETYARQWANRMSRTV